MAGQATLAPSGAEQFPDANPEHSPESAPMYFHPRTALKFIAALCSFVLAAALPDSHAASQNWMAPLNSGLYVSQLSIPGTHDSGARFEPVSGTAKCQNLTIAE